MPDADLLRRTKQSEFPLVEGEIQGGPGCYTSMARLKQAHRRVELLLAVERQAALNSGWDSAAIRPSPWRWPGRTCSSASSTTSCPTAVSRRSRPTACACSPTPRRACGASACVSSCRSSATRRVPPKGHAHLRARPHPFALRRWSSSSAISRTVACPAGPAAHHEPGP